MTNMENMEKHSRKATYFNGCRKLSVNVESTNRAEICGSRRKNTVNDARYLRDGRKTQIGPKRCSNSVPALTKNEMDLHYGY